MAIEDSIGARAAAERLHQISLFVRGYPPAKNEAQSVTSPRHPHASRGGLPHLGDLESVWLYRDDRQIKAITYREVPASQPSYIVAVRRIETIEPS